jgi:hypothetical protein
MVFMWKWLRVTISICTSLLDLGAYWAVSRFSRSLYLWGCRNMLGGGMSTVLLLVWGLWPLKVMLII